MTMLPISSALRKEFEAYMHSRGVPKAEHGAYGKWLPFYLDFRSQLAQAKRSTRINAGRAEWESLRWWKITPEMHIGRFMRCGFLKGFTCSMLSKRNPKEA